MRRILTVLLVGLVGCSATPPSTQPPNSPNSPATVQASQPTPEPTAALTATPGNDATAIAAGPAALDGDQLALAAAWGRVPDATPPTLRTPGPIGEQLAFWVTDPQTHEAHQITATLVVVTPHLAMYVDDSTPLNQAELQQAATAFEAQGWALLSSWYPEAVPAEPITILHTLITGLSGYYAVENRLPPAINPYSNQREMLVLSSTIGPLTPGYQATLTHEIQHLVQRRVVDQPATWLNEGLSMFSEYKLGLGSNALARRYLADPDLQLNSWSDQPAAALAHYGAADLFLRFMDEHSDQALPAAEAAAANANPDRFAVMLQERYPQLHTFEDVVGAWSIANLLNDTRLDDGLYSYRGLPEPVQPDEGQPSASGSTQQLGADYLRWPAAPVTRTLTWTGSLTVPVIPAPPTGGRIWWSGRGDQRASTLSASATLPDHAAQLSYRVWIDLEQDFDYAYLTISTDNGASWQPLATPLSTATNPTGLNNGQGWTGRRPGWETITTDLGAWSGQPVLLRFWVINDQAYHASGVALDGLELDGQPLEWTPEGWYELNNEFQQDWRLYGVLQGSAGTQVTPLAVQQGQATWSIPRNQTATLIVVAATSEALEPGTWRYTLQ